MQLFRTLCIVMFLGFLCGCNTKIGKHLNVNTMDAEFQIQGHNELLLPPIVDFSEDN